jgi:hypothetical protein
MSIRKGLTLPNRQWDRYTDLEVSALDVLKPETLVWLVYGGEIDLVHQAQLKPHFDKYPRTKIIYRPYADNIPQRDPIQWADECWERIKGLNVRFVPAELICDNERNLATEHGNQDNWGSHVDWLTKFAGRWRWIFPSSKLHMGALSPSGRYQFGLNFYKEAGVYSLFDVIDAHVYGDPVTVALPPTTKPICITEFNQWDPAKFLDYYQNHDARVTDAVYFILGGTKDQSAYDLLSLPGAKVYLPFKDWAPKPIPPPKPIPSPTGGIPIMTIPADYTSPNHEGPRLTTTGIVLHATFSGRHDITLQQEYESTCNYFNDPAPGGDPSKAVSAHAVVHVDQIHYPVHEDRIAWHCLTWNGKKLGLEIVRRFPGDPINLASEQTAAKQCAKWCIKYNILPVWSSVLGIEEHRNMPGNNHQDIGPDFDREDFMRRVKYYMVQLQDTGAVTVADRPAITLDPATKKVVLDDLDFLWAYSSATQTSRNPAEAEKVMRERIVGLKIALGLN